MFDMTENSIPRQMGEPEEILQALYKVVCRQTNCADRGFDETDCGKCAFCADVADDVIGTYFKLKAAQAWSSQR
jgi:polyferredoxin